MRRKINLCCLLLVAACSRYRNVTTRVVDLNSSQSQTVDLELEGAKKGVTLGPGQGDNFNTSVTLPRPEYANNSTEPSPPVTANVSVRFRIFGTTLTTDAVICQAGEGVILHAEFKAYNEGTSYASYAVWCWSEFQRTYTRISADSARGRLVQ